MIEKSAIFSECRKYRYTLSRIWLPNKSYALFVCLNPSTADEEINDPTIRRCMGFASRWSYGGMVMVNLFAYRSTFPSELATVEDPIGPKNDHYIQKMGENAGITIVACRSTKMCML